MLQGFYCLPKGQQIAFSHQQCARMVSDGVTHAHEASGQPRRACTQKTHNSSSSVSRSLREHSHSFSGNVQALPGAQVGHVSLHAASQGLVELRPTSSTSPKSLAAVLLAALQPCQGCFSVASMPQQTVCSSCYCRCQVGWVGHHASIKRGRAALTCDPVVLQARCWRSCWCGRW